MEGCVLLAFNDVILPCTLPNREHGVLEAVVRQTGWTTAHQQELGHPFGRFGELNRFNITSTAHRLKIGPAQAHLNHGEV